MIRHLLTPLALGLFLASGASAQTAAAPARPAETGTQRASRILAILDQVAVSPTHARIQSRTYDFKELGRQMGYELFVPASYNASRPNALIVALHCLQCPPDKFIRYEGLTELADQRGYIVVAPMGVNLHGWYGSRGQTGAMSGRREGEPADPENLGALSELDVMNVLGLVRKEFNVDPSRIYLMGHSMGGGGTWYLANKNPTLFAALATAAPAASGSPDQLAAFRHLPVTVIQGDQDELVNVNGTRQWVAKMKELGMNYTYIEVPGGDHMAVIVKNRDNMRRIFDMFDQARKKN